MVRSRSQTNLNKIFLDLCTSPEVRSKHVHTQNTQRKYHPTLKSIKSRSCSDLSNLSEDTFQSSSSSSSNNNQIQETPKLNNTIRHRLLPLGPRKAIISKTSNVNSVTPMESTGFAIQTPTSPRDDSMSLLQTTLKNSTDKSHEYYSSFSIQPSLIGNSYSYHKDETQSLSITMLNDWTLQDKQNRLKDQINKIKQDYQQQYQQSSSNDFLSSSYDAATLPKNYGLSSNLYDDDPRGYGSTLPRSADIHSNTSPFSPSSQLTPRDRGLEHDKPQKSKSFMSSLKHLTLPGRKHRNKDKHDESMSSHASSISQLNTSVQTPKTNAVSHSLSSEYFLASVTDPTPIRRSRSISQSFRNLFRSSSRKKKNAAKADALGEYENGTHNYIIDNPKFLSTSTPTAKKLSFLHRRKSKQKNKEQTNYSTNSLSSVDCSRIESVRDTPVRANVGHPVTMTKAIVQ
ncbi:unnamed protein product [Rotaria sordida]|uniref:Uncharacterized protein n=1 Tax=Rotaria sordida TaxID=392033 RepID=A0A818Y557_9BILA|nr:unnamed protein product [Rotaria sordida]